MTWKEVESRRRIKQFMQQAPEVKGALPNFSGGDFRAQQRVLREHAGVTKSGGPLDRLSPDTAIIVDGVHVYVRLLGFDDQLLELQRETEASHRRALGFLHVYYSLLDRIVRDGGGIRVDFHAARLHFVVAEPIGDAYRQERVERALQIVQALDLSSITTPGQLGYSVARSPLRVGIDDGPCIAIANDSGHEMDPVFLGSPANVAAKLASGDAPGVFATDRVWKALGLSLVGMSASALPGNILARTSVGATNLANRSRDQLLETKRQRPTDVAPPNFVFHRTAPPLAALKFSDLQPSYTIRMEMAALFADIDNFTPFVDAALKSGAGREVVRAMYVIREEQRAVLKSDFGAKRLRFVGDCAIGLHADGTVAETNAAKTVENAALCAAALHHSLAICGQEMPSVATLGLQVGIAYGMTPITRLGIRGEMSVRCAASRAVMDAEHHQGIAERGETALSESALAVSSRIRKLANSQRGAIKLPFAAMEALLSGAPIAFDSAGTSAAGSSRSNAPPPFRAHSGGDD